MKQKLFMVFAAMILLVSTSASAQNAQQKEVKDTAAVAAKVKAEKQAVPKKAESQTPLKGDVNEDGKVDVADIAAIIAIMKANGGVEEGGYYWYVGTVNPMNVNSINPNDIVSDASSMGWRYIGTTVPTYTMQNPLWNGQVNEIVFDNYKDITAYIALPNSVIKVRDGLGNDATGEMTKLGTKEINGVTYTVFQNSNNVMNYSLDLLVY